jgi:hypothetical protein
MHEIREQVGGMTWGWVGNSHEWQTPASEFSYQAMTKLNLNWVTIAFQALQDNAQSIVVNYQDEGLVSDEQLRWAIRLAKSNGHKVCLKPVVNCRNGTWRGFISFFDHEVPGEPNWYQWCRSYQQYLSHYARIAEEESVELFSVGCEMVMADSQADHWRETIEIVRKHYAGLITYNCDKYQEDRLSWWDAVDVISSSGYYPLGTWSEQLDRIEKVVLAHAKPFLFLEAGCPSRSGAPARPNDWTLAGPANAEAQLEYYREMLTAYSRNWMLGFMLWDWPAVLYPADEALEDKDYCIYGKPAANLVSDVYAELNMGGR